MKPPCVLFGLHETFLLLPYVRGAKRCRLVLRVHWLKQFCQAEPASVPVQLGAPLVLGELLRLSPCEGPLVASGFQIDNIKRFGTMEWCLRHYRAVFHSDEIRFEAGSKKIYAAHTSFYCRDELLEFCEKRHPIERARLL